MQRNKIDKKILREYLNSLKDITLVSQKIINWEKYVSKKQKKILVEGIDINKIRIEEYNLPFSRKKLINTLASFPYRGRVGRRMDKVVYYEDVPIGYFQLSSPVLNRVITKYLKEKYGREYLKVMNYRIVELSVCLPIGILSRYLSGKLITLIAMSREIIEEWNIRYGTEVEVLFTLSIYGKSSMYNRIRNLRFIGYTEGENFFLDKNAFNYLKTIYKNIFNENKKSSGKNGYGSHLIRKYKDILNAKVIDLPKVSSKNKKKVCTCVKIFYR